MSAVLRETDGRMWASNKEHFGLSDGFGDPVFEGQLSDEAERLRVIGGGKILPDLGWAPLATGEFLLGYSDEAQEIPGAAMPIEFSRNGTFMAYRKLHENVGSFADYMDEAGARYARMHGIADPVEARDTVMAKLVGRWHDGVPLMAAPTYEDWQAFKAELAAARAAEDKPKLAQIALKYTSFQYRPDPAGTACPVTSHMRRANPRDMLDPNFTSPNPGSWDGSALVNRRRILRRGLPYGEPIRPRRATAASRASSSSPSAPACSASSSSSSSNGCNMGWTSTPAATPARSSAMPFRSRSLTSWSSPPIRRAGARPSFATASRSSSSRAAATISSFPA